MPSDEDTDEVKSGLGRGGGPKEVTAAIEEVDDDDWSDLEKLAAQQERRTWRHIWEHEMIPEKTYKFAMESEASAKAVIARFVTFAKEGSFEVKTLVLKNTPEAGKATVVAKKYSAFGAEPKKDPNPASPVAPAPVTPSMERHSTAPVVVPMTPRNGSRDEADSPEDWCMYAQGEKGYYCIRPKASSMTHEHRYQFIPLDQMPKAR